MEAKGSISIFVAVLLAIAACSVHAHHASSSCRRKLHCGPSNFIFYMHNTVYNPAVDNREYFNSIYSPPPNVSFPIPRRQGVWLSPSPLEAGARVRSPCAAGYLYPPSGVFPNPFGFGIINTFEDPITVGLSNTSRLLGKAQGFYVLNSFREYTLFHLFTANVTEGKFKGTIDIFGQMREAEPVRYLTVIGGTGAFLGARGLATCTRVEFDSTPPAKWTLSFDLELYY
ncbi:hypothetical protein KP509_38G030900 [Ceratopteris richardii]|uniref:Dirigent protein n=1 Tax=Ceratopteris richardii TaxID=49495 RepID=A0A8T2Q3D0_CERRI|nr:hypothetical protein KP509_38G030900 [Ceratopteris richardii]